ncbi:MAG: S8/S53 family peptidase, partial [Acidobacteriia bacterium]|nr:S8/S53 family peptidase [Terriglobia bacterium]
IDVTVWLNPHNRAELDSLAEELYDSNSSKYHAWLTPADIVTKFAPTAKEAQTVAQFLSSHNLPVVAIGPDNFSVHARGTLADVQKAFHVQINNYQVNGTTYRANARDPYVDGAAAGLVSAVGGLDSGKYQHPLAIQTIKQKSSGKGVKTLATSADTPFFASVCFTPVETETISGVDFNNNPATGTYKGNTYVFNESQPGCGYTPPEIWTAYNLTGLYKEGFDGTGQSIAIIDWCGSPTIESDANVFSARFGLPALNSSNFHIYYSSATPPTCAGPDPEINIDVEWAHAIAPGAKINLIVPSTATFMDVDDAELYALANGLGNVISGSYGSEELYTPAATLNEENLINELANVLGVSANFSTGDNGDFTFDLPTSEAPPSVSAPASSPYATAVGGVTLALNPDNTMKWQTGWGNNETGLVDFGSIADPPVNFGFVYGSGGGPSGYFSKPSFQRNLPGTQRQLPDISWLADPFTGGVIAISEPGVYPTTWQAYGGTSLSCPMFSGLWAIANQEAGAPLGQAARHLYSMPKGTITDVIAYGSPTNVTATITDSVLGTQTFTANELAAPLENTHNYYSAIWNYPLEYELVYLITFGTDTHLTVTTGWDNVTGLGTPNGKAFADFFNPGK